MVVPISETVIPVIAAPTSEISLGPLKRHHCRRLSDPLVLFDRFFAGADPTASREVQEKRRRYNASVLDYVTEQAKSLKLKLGRTDNLKLDEYLTGVRLSFASRSRPPCLRRYRSPWR